MKKAAPDKGWPIKLAPEGAEDMPRRPKPWPTYAARRQADQAATNFRSRSGRMRFAVSVQAPLLTLCGGLERPLSASLKSGEMLCQHSP